MNTGSIASKVVTALLRVGGRATLRRTEVVEYDGETGAATSVVEKTASIVASPPVSYSTFHKSADSSAKEGVSVFVIAAQGLTMVPSIGDTVEYAGVRWLVTRVPGTHTINTTVLAYEVEVALG